MLQGEGRLFSNDLVQAGAGVERGLDGEGHDGTVCTAAAMDRDISVTILVS